MNLLKSAGQVLETMAPTIATAVGGPFAGMAITKLEALFGIDPSTPLEDKQTAIEQGLLTANPDQLLALKKADQDFQATMTKLGVDKEALELGDVANARAMQMATKDSTPRILSYLLLAFTGIMISATMFGWSKADSVLAGTMIGYLVSETKAMMQFWFGTTRGSQDKDATIASIAKQP